MTAAHSAEDIAPPIRRLLQRGVDADVYPALYGPPGTRAAGRPTVRSVCSNPADPSAPMIAGTVFGMASLTKIVAVWAGIGTLWEDHQLAWMTHSPR